MKPKISNVRTFLRLLILVLFFSIAGINHYSTVKAQQGGQEMIDGSRMLSFVDWLYGSSPHRPIYEHVAGGGLWSFQIKGFRVSDPLAVVSDLAASKTLHKLMMISLIIPLVGTLLLGRVFCSWICPMGLFGDLLMWIRQRLEKAGLGFFNLPVSRRIKYWVLGFGVLVTLILSVQFFYIFYPPRIVSDWVRDGWTSTVSGIDLAIFGAILLVELLLCQRLWCKCLCPGGALYSLLGKWRLLRVSRDVHSCTACGKCDVACPYDLEPGSLPLGGECDNCGLCVQVCNDDAINYRLTSGRGNQ
jgi:ferredoxin-type protein NapH